MNKIFKILEITWLVMGFVGILMSAYSIITGDKNAIIYFLMFTVVCGVMYALRRRQRVKFENTQKNNEPK